MSKMRVGVALCGSYCTYAKVLDTVEELCGRYDVTAIMSENASVTDSRFGKAEDFKKRLTECTGHAIIDAIPQAEPIGPKKLFDVLLVMPCTGNTAAKLAAGIADNSVTLAVKAHLRNERPVVIAISTNDGLGANAKNIGELMARKHIYFVPFGQDDPVQKPCSLVAHFEMASAAIESAAEGKQLQPILV